MIPVLSRLPRQAVTRIPGPKSAFGSKRARVLWGLPHSPPEAPGVGGVPNGDMILAHQLANGGAPTWFAVSDFGAGYIPWGFWQVAVYSGAIPGSAVNNLAHFSIASSPGEPSAAVAGAVFGAFSALRAAGVFAGFTRAKDFRIHPGAIFDVSSPNPGGQVIIEAPFGVTALDGFYSGDFYLGGPFLEDPLSMMQVDPGWDNPVLLALWSPGNRAILPLSETAPPSPYGGYPYPGNPPTNPLIG